MDSLVKNLVIETDLGFLRVMLARWEEAFPGETSVHYSLTKTIEEMETLQKTGV
jgi:hypothetical protein